MASDTLDMKEIVMAIPDGILVTDLQGTIRTVNPALCALLQRSPEQLVGSPIRDIIAEQEMLTWLDNEEIIETLASSEANLILSTGETSTCIASVRASYTRTFSGDSDSDTTKSPGGERETQAARSAENLDHMPGETTPTPPQAPHPDALVVVVVRDASESRQLISEVSRWVTAEQEAHAQELQMRVQTQRAQQLLESIISSLLDMLFLVDAKGLILRCNPAVTPMLGRTPESLLNHSFHELIAAQDPLELLDWDEVMLLLTSGQTDVMLQTATGSALPTSISGSLVLDHESQLLGVVFLVKDMSQVRKLLSEISREQVRTDELLQNILPASIADRLKDDSSVIADRFEQASILFCDIVGFTALSQEISAAELVVMLNSVFSRIDDLTDRYKVEKIKTIGDAYMVASGLPETREDHASVLADFALELRSLFQAHNQSAGTDLQIRIGINSGPVVAGVIGKRKFTYDLWGDAVNLASRMESHGIPGEIHISDETRALLGDAYECEPRGVVQIKGKGAMKTWFLVSKR